MKKNFWLVFEYFYNTKTLVIIMMGVLCLIFKDTALGFAEDIIAWHFPWNIFLAVAILATLGIIWMWKVWKASAATRNKSVTLTKQAVLVKISAWFRIVFVQWWMPTKKAKPVKKKKKSSSPTGINIGQHRIAIMSIAKTVGIIVIVIATIVYFVPWKWIVGFLVACLLLWALVRYSGNQGAKKFFEKYQTDMTVIGLSIVAIIVLNALVRFMTTAQPKIWEWYWGNQSFFWAWNIGWVFVAFLTSKKDDKDNVLPIASSIRKYVTWALFMGFAVNLVYYKTAGNSFTHQSTPAMNQVTSSPSYANIPVDVAKRVVCECESNCQQFETDKDGNPILDDKSNKIPLKNKGIPEKGIPPSGAFGKYQFLELHRKIALGLNPSLDLNTEDGQERYFEYLYGKEGFKPWDHDNQFGGGSACWGLKLAGLGYYKDEEVKLPARLTIVEAPANGELSQIVKNPKLNNGYITWPSAPKECEVVPDGDESKKVPCLEANFTYVVNSYRFRSTGTEPLKFEVVVRRQ